MRFDVRRLLVLATLLLFALALPAVAAEKFLGSDDAKEKDEPQKFLKSYDKLVKGDEVDWAWFADGFSGKSIRSVSISDFSSTGRGRETRGAAEGGADYLKNWVEDSKLGWKVVKGGGDLVLEGNVVNAWEPHGAARYWGGWMANPGTCVEVIGRDKAGKTLFEIRHKSRGSTVDDAIENALENVVSEIEKKAK